MPVVNRGAAPGDQNADTAYAAFGKVNDKFDSTDTAVQAIVTALGGKADATAVAAALNGKQDLSAVLTALAGLSAAAGIVEQTGASAFTKRPTGVANATDLLTRADGDSRYTTALPGSVVQSVAAELTTFTSGTTAMAGGADTVPQITDGTLILAAPAITPISATNLLRVTVTGEYTAGAATNMWGGLFRDAVAAAKMAQLLGVPASDYGLPLALRFQEVAGAVTPTTYRFRMGNQNGVSLTWAVNGISTGRRFGGSQRVVIIVEEIKV